MDHRRNWIFIRGLARHSGHWGPFTAALKQRRPLDSFELLDTPGNGTECHRASPLRIRDYVEDLRKRSQFLKSDERPILLTISLGSMIGVDWGARYPQELSGLVTINTSDRGRSPFWQRLRPNNYLFFLDLILKRPNSPLLEKDIIDRVTHDFPGKDQWIEEFEKMQRGHKTSKSNFLRQLRAAGRFTFPQKKPDVPVLMLNSLGDELVHPNCSKSIATDWQIPLLTHPSSGHDLPLEDPHWVADQISQWISELPSAHLS